MYFVVMFIFLITNEYAIVRRGVVNFYDVQRYGGNKRNYYLLLKSKLPASFFQEYENILFTSMKN